MKYYRFSWEVIISEKIKDSNATVSNIIAADNQESAFAQLKKELLASGEEMPENPKVEVLSLEDYIAEAEKITQTWFYKFYLYTHYDTDTITVREYAHIWRDLVKDREKYLTALLDANRVRNLMSMSHRILDLSKISVEDYYKFLKKALETTDQTEFDQLLAKLPHLYK